MTSETIVSTSLNGLLRSTVTWFTEKTHQLGYFHALHLWSFHPRCAARQLHCRLLNACAF